jgi:hypothetical protein
VSWVSRVVAIGLIAAGAVARARARGGSR